MPEGGVYLELRTALYLILRDEFAGSAFIGSQQFLYWDPTDPKKCLAPDLMVRREGPDLPLPYRKQERAAKEAALLRIAELEAELRRR
jgi:hypothetical protein